MNTDEPVRDEETTSTRGIRSAVILARGLGMRMRKADPDARLGEDQAQVAAAGVKAMIPIGRPFLDYVLGALADAGFSRVCIVIGPEHASIREHYGRAAPPTRLSIEFAIQEQPLGTADAVLAAEKFARTEPFIVLNSDNYYPVEVLARLRRASPLALIGFARSVLIESGNVSTDRVQRFGALELDALGDLVSITPRQGAMPRSPDGEIYASMNCWLFDSRIFDVCRRVPVSPRGEYELPRAVQMAVDTFGMRFQVVRLRAAVLDLSTRADIAEVQARLAGVDVSY